MADVQLKKIEKSFGAVKVIKGVDLYMTHGEFVVFVGPSGCGKSTLLRMIAGLEDITGGELYIDGQLCNDIAPRDRGNAMVFQSYALYPHMTVYENVGFALRFGKMPMAERDAKIREVARILQMEELLDRKPAQLSGGQRQRVEIGRAIVRHPKAFLFDEPLSNLDASLRVDMRMEIARPMATRCRWPPDSCDGLRSSRSSIFRMRAASRIFSSRSFCGIRAIFSANPKFS
jgi:multiple sugar transport system ATP-binding protein